MSLDKNLLVGCTAAVLLFATFIGSITYYNVHEANLIAEAIKGGADPVAAYCGISGPILDACIIRETKLNTQSN